MRRWNCLLLLFLAGSAAAQTASVPRAAENIDVSIVNVDTVVTDKHGVRVHGLRKDDFEIYENGVRQPITNFAEYASERQAASAGAATPNAASQPAQAPPPQHRTIIVVAERFH